ncbi:hypothetical protein ACP70R_036588 [Stipagrostis hirtigluma subsp. patula]
MFPQFSPTLLMSIAALTLTLLFISGDAAVHELVAAAAPSPSSEPYFGGGFSLPIVHRNALASPLRHPTATTLDFLKEEIQLASSSSRKKALLPSRFLRGMYLVPLRIGGFDRFSSRYLMFDTGSDLSWTQCAPCKPCSRGHYPPYNPSRSSTFRSVSCDDPLCEHGPGVSCDESLSGRCKFERSYPYGSTAAGYLASDIFHFNLEADNDYRFEPEIVFGCALNESSSFVREYNSGILALGFSSLSFVAQVRMDKFSYCVTGPPRVDEPSPGPSYLRFGSEARMSGKRIPFRQHKDKYVLYLKSVIYQHGSRLSQQQPVPVFVGDEACAYVAMIVDSGTMALWLPGPIFYPLLKIIEAGISLSRVPFSDNPNAFCYTGNMTDVAEVSVTLGFVGGANMELFSDALFFEFKDEWICLGIIAHDMPTLGIYAQRNTNMGFDLSNMEIAIDQAGCGA